MFSQRLLRGGWNVRWRLRQDSEANAIPTEQYRPCLSLHSRPSSSSSSVLPHMISCLQYKGHKTEYSIFGSASLYSLISCILLLFFKPDACIFAPFSHHLIDVGILWQISIFRIFIRSFYSADFLGIMWTFMFESETHSAENVEECSHGR